MSYKTLESLFEKYSRIQMIGPVGSGKSRLLREFAENHPNVALSSTELQRRIQRALAPFWQKRFISLRDEDAPRVRDLLLKPKFFLHTEHYVEDNPFPPTNPGKLDEALAMANLPESVLKVKLLSLSNGELRRILLARLWMESPDYILLDDPYGGHDPEYRNHLARGILKMAEKDTKLISEMADDFNDCDTRILLKLPEVCVGSCKCHRICNKIQKDEGLFETK